MQILAGRLFISSVIIGEDSGILSKHPVTIGARSGILLSERTGQFGSQPRSTAHYDATSVRKGHKTGSRAAARKE